MPDNKYDRPIVAISACLMGQNVRYDGDHQYNELIESTLKPIVQITTFCPEVSAGLGTPRPPINLLVHDSKSNYKTEDILAVGVENPSLDVTAALTKTSELYIRLFEHVDGIVFKARSPSCGLNDTPVLAGSQLTAGRGLFARIITEALPGIAVIDELDFADKLLRKNFIETITSP